MLHDIVLALGGIGGEFLRNLLNEELLSVSFSIHPCERKILEELADVAENYKTIQSFLKKVPHFGEEIIKLDGGCEVKTGMYLRAFCNGLYDCLEPYRKNLIKLEMEILENPYFTLSNILAFVSGYCPLLTSLNYIINQIVRRKLRGCKILQLLHQNLSSGIEMVDRAMERIMHCCHLVMLKQLTSLLLYGELNDPYSEFFIEAHMTQDGLQSSMTTLDSESLPETALSESNIPDYRVKQDLVPSYIPPSIPEKAKFIGKTVVLFSRDPRGFDIKTHNAFYDKLESSLLEEFKTLQTSDVLDISVLESVIDKVRSCVTQHLVSLAKDEADLKREIKLIKDYYLLGRGELFVSFLRKAAKKLDSFPESLKGSSSCVPFCRDLNNTFYTSVRNVHLNSDLISQKFSIHLPTTRALPPHESNIWSVMTLEYKPPWPLHQLFLPSVLAQYNSLFIFLLQVKKAELCLHDTWIDTIKKKDIMIPQEAWTLRNNLMFLVHNLQCYLQLDVLESEFSELMSSLDDSKDFDQVIHHHTVFLERIRAQSFLINKEVQNQDQPTTIKRHPVNVCIMKILKLSEDFCKDMEKGQINKGSLENKSKELDANISSLMTLITLLGQKAPGLHLLLLRLDYNRYFSSRV